LQEVDEVKKRTFQADGAEQRVAACHREISELTLDTRNPRLHSPKQVRQIARSIQAFGFVVPVLIDAKLKVVAGHGRVMACRLLGRSQVPTISLHHRSETQIRAFAIADNRLTENSDWNDRLLAEQLRDLAALDLDFDLEATGFEMGEIDLRIENLSADAVVDRDPADTAQIDDTGPPISRPGDLWELGVHRVCCGNALDPAAFRALVPTKNSEDAEKSGVLVITAVVSPACISSISVAAVNANLGNAQPFFSIPALAAREQAPVRIPAAAVVRWWLAVGDAA
jgi:hypothetical protein